MAKKKAKKNQGKGTRSYTVAEVGDKYCVVRGGEPIGTPMGNPLRTIFRDLAEEVAEDVEQHGLDPTAAVSMYACLCSCLDFIPLIGMQNVILDTLPAIHEDPVLHMSADPEIMFIQMAAYEQPYFAEHGLRQKTPEDVVGWAGREMATWSPQEVIVVQLAGAIIHSPLMGMALAQDQANLDTAAFGFCGKFWEHRMKEMQGICFGAFPDFFPNGMDEAFCDTVCLTDENGEESAEPVSDTFGRKCGVVKALDVWRRFAAYGRKQRLRVS